MHFRFSSTPTYFNRQDLKTTNNNSETNVRMDEEDGEIEIKTESAAGAAENPYVTEEEILVKTEDQTALTTANAPGAAPLSAPRNLEGGNPSITSIHPLVTEFSGGTPEGEALQNMIQAYYWAGYYKGFYEGLQQAKGSNER